MMKTPASLLSRHLAAACLALAGLAGGLAATPALAESNLGIRGAPPPPRYEVVPAPRRGQVWVPGHWERHGPRQVWLAGHWIAARPGYRYNPPAWEQHDGRWDMRPGRWQRGDADGDGVPNRADRRPNDPYRR
jgi:hypothetical protein